MEHNNINNKKTSKTIFFYLYHGIVSHPMNNISYIDEIAEQKWKIISMNKKQTTNDSNIKIWFSQNKNREKNIKPYSIGNCHKLYELRTRIVFFFWFFFFCCGKALCFFFLYAMFICCVFWTNKLWHFFLSFLSCLVACCYRDKIYCSLSQTVFCYDNVLVWPMI